MTQHFKRVIYFIAGILSLSLYVLFALLPGPAIPYLLISLFFFINSSPAFHYWLLHNRYFGRYLKKYAKGGITLKFKIIITIIIAVSISIVVYFLRNDTVELILACVTSGVGVGIIWFLKLPDTISAHGYRIGVTGPFASGKSTLAKLFEKYNFTFIEADLVGHDMLNAHADKLKHYFGSEIIGKEGLVDRKILGSLVFSNPEKLKELNRLIHPKIFNYIEQQLYQNKSKDHVIVAAVLHEIGLHRLCDRIIFVSADEGLLLSRGVARDGRSEGEIKNILKQQEMLNSKKALADDHFINDGNLDSLEEQVIKVLKDLKRLS